MHSKIGELLRARNKMIEISAIPTANKGSLIEDCRAVVPLPANSDVDVEADLIDLQTSLRVRRKHFSLILQLSNYNLLGDLLLLVDSWFVHWRKCRPSSMIYKLSFVATKILLLDRKFSFLALMIS